MASILHCYPNPEAEEISSMATDLPHELLISILVRLPLKSLLHCRRVCTSWRSLISTPLFISSHLHHQSISGRRTLLLRRSDLYVRYTLNSDDDSLTQIAQFDSPLPGHHTASRILGSVNGLVCLMIHNSLILWNPTIRKSLILPLSSIFSSPLHFGFGFDPSSNDFKVVRVHYGKNSKSAPCVEIYRLSTRSWSMVDLNSNPNPEASNLPLLFPRQAYLNGVVHWLANDSTIVGFDLRIEKFRVLKLPGDLKDSKMEDVAIAVWCGFLALFELRGSVICLWVMKEYDSAESWTRKCVISGDGFHSPVRVKSIGSHGRILIEYSSGHLSWFDPATHQVSPFPIQDRGNLAMFHMKPFTQSLVLLDDGLAIRANKGLGLGDDCAMRLGRWSREEEELLVKAWLSFAKERKIKSLWSHVETYFGMHNKGGKQRGLSQLQQHWYHVNKAVSKFHSCYSKVWRLQGGLDENGIVLKAYEVYKDERNSQFRHEHVWRLVKDEAKWRDNALGGEGEGSSKRAKVTESESGNAATSDASSEMEEMKSVEAMNKHTRALELNAEMMRKEMEMKQREMDLQIIYKDTSGMTEEQRILHQRLLDGAIKRIESD